MIFESISHPNIHIILSIPEDFRKQIKADATRTDENEIPADGLVESYFSEREKKTFVILAKSPKNSHVSEVTFR